MMTADTISLTAGTLLSLVFSYLPGAKDWFGQYEPAVKRLIMLVLILVTAASTFGIACLGWGPAFGIELSCNQPGVLGLTRQIVIAIIANQGIFAISPHLNSGTLSQAGE